MAAVLTISGEKELDELVAEAEALGGELKGVGAKRVIGRAVANLLRSHFTALEFSAAHHRTASALGAPRTGFYSEAARGVQQPEIDANGVVVAINKIGLALRYFGGIVRPVRAKLLTIAARIEAYGKRASEFHNLRLIMFRRQGDGRLRARAGPLPPSGAGALVEREASVLRGTKKAGTAKGDSIGGLIYFWLVRQATQKADPTVLPTDTEIGNAAVNAARSFVERLQLRKAAA